MRNFIFKIRCLRRFGRSLVYKISDEGNRRRAETIASCNFDWSNSLGGNTVRYSATWMPLLSSSSNSICSCFLSAHKMIPNGDCSSLSWSYLASQRR